MLLFRRSGDGRQREPPALLDQAFGVRIWWDEMGRLKTAGRRMLIWIAVALSVVALGVLAVVLMSWRRPELGVVDGRLRPCGEAPNCVCSCAEDELHAVSPLALDNEDPMSRIRQVMAEFPRTKLIEASDGYLRYECASPLLGYIDDLEFHVNGVTGVVDVRSASRVGHSDLGTNRKRIDEIRRRCADGT